MAAKFPVYCPVKLTREDVTILDVAAKSQQVKRSVILRELIRSLDTSGTSSVKQRPPAA